MLSIARNFLRAASIALALSVGALVATDAFADKITLKDGTVLEGKIVREGEDFVIFKIKVGSIEQEKIFDRKEITKLERDDPAPKTDEAMAAKEAEAKKSADAKKAEGRHTGATRVAILNFGPPSSWQGGYGDMVGVQISAEAFRKAIPLLEKAKVDVVVIRVNSGGGYGLEVGKFHQIFEKEYKPRFRTVAWIESAISAAAMSPWVIEEMYFFPKGNIGACTGWSGNLVATKGFQLEMMLVQMEEASKLGKKDPSIMRAMQVLDAPLSVDIDESGKVIWMQNEQGKYVLNPKTQIYTMTASEAVQFGFARGVAANNDELAKAMGLQEVEWVALDATNLVDKSIKDNDAAEKRNQEVLRKYMFHIGLAQQLPDKQRRGAELAICKRLLNELKTMVKLNPNFEFHLGIPPEWFVEQDELIKKLAALP